MIQKPNAKSSWLVWVALLATLGLCYLASQSPEAEEKDLVAEVAKPRPSLASKSISNGSQVASLRRPNPAASLTSVTSSPLMTSGESVSLTFRNASMAPSTKDLFHRYVPIVRKATKSANVTIPPIPVAPKAPFQYVGKLEDELATTYFFMAQQRLVSARLGDKLDGLWKLEREDAQSFQLEYLPLALRQSLPKQAQGKVKTLTNKDLTSQVTQ